jgi:hypothetical protein
MEFRAVAATVAPLEWAEVMRGLVVVVLDMVWALCCLGGGPRISDLPGSYCLFGKRAHLGVFS